MADFERYDATKAEVMMDKHTNRPRGFGFVFFKDEGGLKDAIRDMHDKVGPLCLQACKKSLHRI